MTTESRQTADDGVAAQLLKQPDGLPSWLTSLVMHLLLVILLASWYVAPPIGDGGEVVLNCEVSADGDDLGMAGGEPVELSDATISTATESPEAISAVELPSQETAESAEHEAIAQSLASLLDSEEERELLAGAGGSADGFRGGASGDGHGAGLHPGRTRLYGVQATGTKFVYVFDHSESMGSVYYHNSPENGVPRPSVPMESAQTQLMSSLDELKRGQRFQIVFYNHQPLLFQFGSSRGRLLSASREAKQRAKHFVSEVYPTGGTNHIDALAMALQLRPDVIFLLTDGEEKDDLTPLQLKQVRQLNASRATIHVIQFVQNPRPESTLVRLAEDNGGQHVFIDITRVGGWAN